MKLSLGVVLSLCIAGLQFLAVLVVVTSSYVTSERALIKHARELLSDVATNTSEHSRGFLTPARGAVELATRLAENEIVASDNKELLEKLLFQQLITAPQFAGVFYGDKAGNFVYVMRSENPGPFRSKVVTRDAAGRTTNLIWRDQDYSQIAQKLDPEDTYDPRIRPWYQGVSEQMRSIWTDPYIFFSSQKPGITVAAPVLDARGGLQGVIGVDIEIDKISEFLANLNIGVTGKAVILNHNGDVIAHPNADLIKTRTADGGLRFTGINEIDDPVTRAAFGHLITQNTAKIDQEISTSFVFDDAPYVSTITPMISDTLPWTIGVFAPEADFIQGIKDNRFQNVLIAAAVAGMTALVGLWLANHIHKPVRALALRATQISRGEYDHSEPFPRTFTELERANDTMTQEIARRKKSELEFGRTFNLSSRGMIRLSPDTASVQKANASFCKIIGYSRDQLTGKSFAELLHPDDREGMLVGLTKIGPTFNTLSEGRLIHRNKSHVWVNLNAIPIHDEQGLSLHTVVTIDDVTDKHAAEARIEKLNQDIAHRARINTMDELSAGLAHELNQPLTALSQNADAALMTAAELDLKDPELLGILKDLDTQAHRAGDIVRAMRNFIRKEEATKATFDLSDLILQTVSLVMPEAKENGVKIKTNLAHNAPVFGSHVQIAQVMVNLLRNAIEAIAPTADNQRRITITSQIESGMVITSVEDTGPGISSDIELFSQFATTKTEGMGLGLSISRDLIAAQGGKLWLEPDTIEGAKFMFKLPIKGKGSDV